MNTTEEVSHDVRDASGQGNQSRHENLRLARSVATLMHGWSRSQIKHDMRFQISVI